MFRLVSSVWLLLLVCLFPAVAAQPVIGAAVNAASNDALLAPGCWMSIYGTDLAPETKTAAAVPLPASISGVSVSVNGIAAPLLFVSAGQINALVPFDVQVPSDGTRVSATVSVTTPAGTSSPHAVFLTATAPALYTRDMTGQGAAIILSTGYRLLDVLTPGDVVIVYAAGLGQTDPPAQSDSGGASSEPYNRVPAAAMPEVWIGDQQAEVLFAGLAPGFPGIYQLNLRLPSAFYSDRILLRSGLAQSNIAQVGVPAGANTANVSGTITGLFPSDGTDPRYPMTGTQTFSVMPQAVRFSVSLDILPNAQPFTILATSDSGSASILIDPVQGSWLGSNTMPLPPVRAGDFSALLPTPVLDYMTCQDSGNLTCLPLPNNMMPLSRMDPSMPTAMALLPLPNALPSRGVGIYMSSAALPASGHFAIDDQNNTATGFFGAIANIPLSYLNTRTVPLRLYVDGKLIASMDISLKVVTRPD
ncbi:MAG: hypothetical protein U0Q18_08465 [Bryobacteraceae bacterium]